ncbi:hypothetical protein P872_10335 [Rhodonellum psychrophilum GCM71 = DSM 17998]|uniref:TNase-like domain-containing protein n=2 Tax=Rhodonellum TaxID=336827 RepID=U5C022_9BACT|nr:MULTISPECIES: thermonuclease family protein [Rhodonellum]ERM81507.1 hypothetical protein P872_10335 [Rhodonellum psychrophilum GCM71 = DSM 17998]SDZ29272.1 micrococcal nuclease [Rhodonellum ikkaensis]
MHLQKSLSWFFLIFLIFSIAGNLDATNGTAKNDDFFQVEKVVDGDTFWVINKKGEREKIRLIGVDTPEVRRSKNKEIGHYGKEASDFVKNLLDGQRVRLEYDVAKYDRYKRTLAYVYLEDGTFLNAHLVKEGYAAVMTIPPNVKHADLFVDLQRMARKKKKGLWNIP